MGRLVTVAIASYNNAPYIQRCIDSVINQTYLYLEILIVDDGSKDDTFARIKKYKSDERVRFIFKENGGLSTVRQRALDEASGDYICFVDADDYLTSEYVEKMLVKILADKSDICVCSTRFEDEKGSCISEWSKVFSCKDSKSPFIVTTEELSIIDNPKIGELHISDSWNKIYRTEFLINAKVKFCMPKGLNGSDLLFNKLLLVHKPKYSIIQDTCYVHVVYPKSAVHRKNKDLIHSFMFIVTKIISETETLGNFIYLKDSISYFYIKSIYASYMDVFQDSHDVNEMKNNFLILYNLHKKYLNKTPQIILKHAIINSLKINIFLFFLNNANSLLPYFFRLRKQLKNIM